MGDKKHFESELCYSEEVQFHEKSESTALTCERVGSGQDWRTGRIYDEPETFVQ